MTYKEAVEYIENTQSFGSKPGLLRMAALCSLLGNPQKGLKIVHITGTNGKGSTASMTAKILRAAGYNVGMYVSPYVDDFRERIQYNGEYIPEQDMVEVLEELIPAVNALRERGFMQPSQFEMETAMAFLYYRKIKADYVVLEAGVGGKNDCTNVVEAPLVSVITSISLDHTNVLGSTVAEIASDKSGIIKKGCEAVITPRQPESAVEVIRDRCTSENVNLTIPQIDTVEIIEQKLEGTTIKYNGLTLAIPMGGDHQILNTVTACEIAFALRRKNVELRDEDIENGIIDSRMPGRCEPVEGKPLAILDGGHNPAAIDALCAMLDKSLNNRRLIVIMGMFADKDWNSCVKKISSRATFFIATSSGQPRSQEAEGLAQAAKEYCDKVETRPVISDAVSLALDLAEDKDVILVCGSIYNINSARNALKTNRK